jgi:hypothetical protein
MISFESQAPRSMRTPLGRVRALGPPTKAPGIFLAPTSHSGRHDASDDHRDRRRDDGARPQPGR